MGLVDHWGTVVVVDSGEHVCIGNASLHIFRLDACMVLDVLPNVPWLVWLVMA